MNCWEFKNCGREPGGSRVDSLGACPAATEKRADGCNKGKNGGRCCWAIAGTLCGNAVQGCFASKVGNCMRCDFFLKVCREEGTEFMSAIEVIKKLR